MSLLLQPRRVSSIWAASSTIRALACFTFTGTAIVTRVANLRIPGPDAQVSLIAKTFDLTAYDQMLRSPVLRRWVQAPPLVVETRTLQFTDVNASVAVGTSDAMSDAEYQSLTADLGWALPQISGSTFAGFASVVKQSSPAGAVVPILNTGQITVARVTGLTAATGFWGYGRWQTDGDTVVSGNLVLDLDFERGTSPFHRSLRTHELGHAMGYNHVTTRGSFMNSAATIEPTPFDLDACRIAFQRRPGNASPDFDPAGISINAHRLTWGPAIR